MSEIAIVLFIVFFISTIISPFFYGDKVNKYIREKKGKLISTEYENIRGYNRSGTNINRNVIIKYYDKNKNQRSVTLHFFGPFSSFGDDEITEYSTNSPEYKELKEQEQLAEIESQQLELKKQIEYNEKALTFQEKRYSARGKNIAIKQEYSSPNVGEFVYIDHKLAPDGKYGIGFLCYIHVINGRIHKITSF